MYGIPSFGKQWLDGVVRVRDSCIKVNDYMHKLPGTGKNILGPFTVPNSFIRKSP